MSRLARGALVLLVLVAACGEDDEGAERDDSRDAAVYAAVIRDVADGVRDADDEEADDPVVFIEALEPDGDIPLEVQAGVVLQLEEHPVDVSFIDDREQAVELDEEGEPVREGAVLLAVGPVPEGPSRVRVQARRYLQEGEEERLRYVVELVGEGWEVTERTTFR